MCYSEECIELRNIKAKPRLPKTSRHVFCHKALDLVNSTSCCS